MTAVGFLYLVGAYGVEFFTIPSGSMVPTLLPDDSVLVNRFIYHVRSPRRGDIVVFHFPQADGRDFIKRVIGLPGDVVEEQDGRFRVNGLPIQDPWVRPPCAGLGAVPSMPARRVPDDQVFVLGDNREASLDSRYWGTVDARHIIGKAVMVCWSRGAHWWDIRWRRIGRWLP